jgi:hypothetical protein
MAMNHDDLSAADIRGVQGAISSNTQWLNHGTTVLAEM